jgi:replicative DNA helicase
MAQQQTASERSLPHDLEVEKSILGAVLLDNYAFNPASQIVSPGDFFSDANRHVFEAMAALSERGEAIDTITLRAELEKLDALQRVGGPAFLSSLIDGMPSAANVEQYARIIKDKSSLRQLIATSNEIIRDALDASSDTDELLDRAEHRIFEISEGKMRKGFVSVRDVAFDTMKEIEELMDRGEYVTGVPTGFTRLDSMTAGLQKGDLVILAARPSMGKTALALNIGMHVALEASGSVGFFSLEMSVQQVVRRLITAVAQVDAHKLSTGFLSHKDKDKLLDALHRLSETKMFIDDTAGMTVLEMRAKARRLAAEHGLDLLIIDYLQLMRGAGRQENRNLEIGEISRSVKALAKELQVPVIALSQLSRSPESRSGHRPQLSDLRESGNLEQDADVVAFIFRPEVYSDDPELEGVAELIVGKQRNGPIGTVPLVFLKPFTLFKDRSDAPEDNWQ